MINILYGSVVWNVGLIVRKPEYIGGITDRGFCYCHYTDKGEME